MRLDYADFRFSCICLCLFLYGIFGSPTPDNPGGVEIVLGVLLILASLSGRFVFRMFHVFGLREAAFDKRYCIDGEAVRWRYWHLWGYAFLVYCFTIPLIVSAIQGNELRFVMRDLFAISFLMMPVFLSNLLLRKAMYIKYFTGFVIWVGVCFGFRSWYPHYFGEDIVEEYRLLYLSLSPAILFAVISLVGFAVCSVYRMNVRTIFRAVLFLIVCSVIVYWCVFAMADSLQRASLGMALVAAVLVVSSGVLEHPLRFIFLVIPLILFFIMGAHSYFDDIIEQLLRKNRLVAFNSRFEEFSAVLDSVTYSSFGVVLGHGWGAQFSSPAVGNLMVNYTHNIFSAGLLKTGLAGVMLLCFYIFPVVTGLFSLLLKRCFRLISGDRLLALALLMPLLISVIFYANYKSLDFGVLMLLGVAVCRKNAAVSKEE